MITDKSMQRSDLVVERNFDYTTVHVRHSEIACKKDYSLRLIDVDGIARVMLNAVTMRFPGEDSLLHSSDHASVTELQCVLAFIQQRWSVIRPEGPLLHTAVHFHEGDK